MTDTLVSLAATIITTLVAWLAQAIQKHIKDARLAKLLETVSGLTEAAVASAFQLTVKRLKDPDKPGEFTQGAAASIKIQVIDQVKEAAPEVMRELEDLGIKTLDQLLGQIVERHVVALNAITGPVPVTAVTVVPTKPVGGSES